MNNYDIGALFAAAFTAWLGPRLGPVLGIYTVILIAAVMGAAMALLRREPDARPHPVLYMALIVGITCLTTMPATLVAVEYVPMLTGQVLAPLVALLIAGIGHDWLRIGTWAIGLAGRVIGRRFGVPDKEGGQP